jgi:integrase
VQNPQSLNPVTAVKRPKLARPKKAVPSPEQVKAVVELARETPVEIAVIIAATTGGRLSEIAGLQWSDIDLTSGA